MVITKRNNPWTFYKNSSLKSILNMKLHAIRLKKLFNGSSEKLWYALIWLHNINPVLILNCKCFSSKITLNSQKAILKIPKTEYDTTNMTLQDYTRKMS